VTAILAFSGGLSLPFLTAAVAQESSLFDLDANVTEAPSPTVPLFTVRQSPPTTIGIEFERNSVPVSLEIAMQYVGSNPNELTEDVGEVMELYLWENLSSLDSDKLKIQDVLLLVAFTTTQRRRLQRDIIVEVAGNILYDIASDGCLECAVDDISNELGSLLTREALDQLFRDYEIEGFGSIANVGESSREDEWILRGSAGANGSSEPPRDSRGNLLERPSLLSIIFGFVLTGIAAIGLVFYMYVFYRKRQKRLRKERQQKHQGIQYPRIPPPRVNPTTPAPIIANPMPVTTPVSGPGREEQFDEGTNKVETAPYGGGPADSFARELQMAASLDEQAWEDFQRRKRALDVYQETPSPRMAISPIPSGASKPPSPESSSGLAPWNKSFPYGDEADEEGVEWTAEMAHQAEEKKEDHTRTNRDPDPTTPAYKLTSAALKSLEEYEDPGSEIRMDDETSEVVDEVARLSRFVQRYEKRKERRMQWEAERMSQVGSPADFSTSSHSRHVGFDGSVSARGSSMRNSQFPPDNSGNNGKAGQSPAPRESQTVNNAQSRASGGQPRASAYRGITMAGEMYEDPSLENIARPSISMSESGSDSYLEEEDFRRGKKTERLGITPFNAQEASASPVEYSRDRMESYPESSSLRPNTGGSSSSHRARLSDLRKNQAIADSSQSDVNIGGFKDPGDIPLSGPPTRQPDRSQNPWLAGNSKSRAPKPAAGKPSNPNFSKLRDLFETRPKNAIFPPDEHWQRGVSKN